MSKNFKKSDEWFGVHSIRTIQDPNEEITRRELVVSLAELPHLFDDELHLGPNPRRPAERNTGQRQEIMDTLVENGEEFHHLNRGLTIVAKEIEVDDKRGKTRVRLHLATNKEEGELFGLLDGGHTNKIINDFRKKLISEDDDNSAERLKNCWVNVQVLVPVGEVDEVLTDRLRAISRARNNNVQVKRRDLENLDHLFDSIKSEIANEPFSDSVRWRDGDSGKTIDGQALLILLMIFHEKWVGYNDDPVMAYGQKGLCLDEFKNHLETKSPKYTQSLIEQLPTLLALFDAIELEFPNAYNRSGGKFGKFTNVKKYDEGKSAKTQLQSETKWKYTTAWIYPLYAGFRQLLDWDDQRQKLSWKQEPLEFWENHQVELVRAYSHQFKPIASATATKVGRNVPAFLICRQTIQLLTLKD
jgi:hypothetical protein